MVTALAPRDADFSSDAEQPSPMHRDVELERMLARQRHEQNNATAGVGAVAGAFLGGVGGTSGAANANASATARGIGDGTLPAHGTSVGVGFGVSGGDAGDSCGGGESLWLVCERWRKLHKDFYNAKKDRFDLSKIPDIYDCIKYDALHNTGLRLRGVAELYALAKAFADVVVSQEYGIDVAEKIEIGARIAHHLLRKVFFDMTAVTTEDTVEALSAHEQNDPHRKMA